MTKQLFLRTTDANGKSYGGFQWPMEVGATVTAPDWNDTAECGNGLHGLLNGEGDSWHLSLNGDALWWIVEAADAIGLDGKHKFRECTVVMFGTKEYVTAELHARTGAAVHFLVKSGGNWANLTGGDGATLTGGYRATLTGGDRATLTGGYRATLTGGDWATLTGGDWATLTGGDGATLTGGYRANLTGGDGATLTGGDRATLTGGDRATIIFLKWINGHRRVLVGYVGENGIKPNVAYRASDDFTQIV